ncbi:MAG: MFS transporter [Clostridia bacterium]|nr:MFS transporter [Clostridia bacterium]
MGKLKKVRSVGGSKVSKLDMIALGLGDFGYGLVSSTVATYITSFGTMALPGVSEKGFTALLMGIAVGIAVVFDAVSDPIMGFLSDNFKSKIFGKRHLFMLIGLIGMMATGLAVWYVPYQTMSAAGIFIWFTLFLILLRTFNTMYYTPVGAFSVEISTDYNERMTIQAVRSILYIIGLLLCVVVMGSFQNKYAGYYIIDGSIQNPYNFENIVYHIRNAVFKVDNGVITSITDQAGLESLKQAMEARGLVYQGFNYEVGQAIPEGFAIGFRKGQQLPGGYRDFAVIATAITAATSAFLLIVTSKYIKILRLREEKEAEEKGIDLNAPKPQYTMEMCRNELIEKGVSNPTPKQTRALLRDKRADAGQITIGAIFRNFFMSFKVKEMRIIAIGYVVAMMSATLIISLGFNVFTFTFDLHNAQMYFLMGALLLCTIGFQPLWMKLSKVKTKQFAMFTGLIISFIGCIVLFICFLCRVPINHILHEPGKSWWAVLILAPALMLAGAGTGVLYSIPLALVGDVVVIQKDITGVDKTGTYAGVMTFCYKAGQGIITAVSTALMGVVGFQTGATEQTREAADGIGWILCIGVLVFVGAGLIIFSRLKLDKDKINEILAKKTAIAESVANGETSTPVVEKIENEESTEEASNEVVENEVNETTESEVANEEIKEED